LNVLQSETPIIYLKPGEIHFAKDPAKIITVLGSCISIIMYTRIRKIGSICHAVMPSLESARVNTHLMRDAFQYVDSSVEWMLSKFEEAGVKRSDIEVKLFGGAEISVPQKGSKSIAVGRKNVEAAIKIIEHKKLKLKAWNVGGNRGRKLIFYTDTGEVNIKYVGRTFLGSIRAGEGMK
jgi:chemotaxis protein CheD